MGCSLRLQRFCCCCSLRTGTLVIGTLGWLNTLFQIFITPGSMHLNNHKYGHADKNEVIDNSLFARIGVCVISLLVSVLLIVGVYKKNNKFMLPWLVLQCLGCVAISIIALICFGATFMVPSQHIAVFIALTVALILMGSLAWYCWICVWSHYMELNVREEISSPNIQYSPTHASPPPYNKAGAPLV